MDRRQFLINTSLTALAYWLSHKIGERTKNVDVKYEDIALSKIQYASIDEGVVRVRSFWHHPQWGDSFFAMHDIPADLISEGVIDERHLKEMSIEVAQVAGLLDENYRRV